MRLFLAIEIDEAVARSIVNATAPLRAAEPALDWIDAAMLHLTVKFVGAADEPTAARLADALDDLAQRHRPFEMTLRGIGAFPNFRRARVVWIGVEGDARLELLHHDAELCCLRAGVEVEGRPFRPHVTLARVGDVLPVERARALARAARHVPFETAQDVSGLTLFDSAPSSSGAPYRRLQAATFGGR